MSQRALRIAVDGRVLGHRGVGRYLANVLLAASRLKHPHQFWVYLGPTSRGELVPKDPRFRSQTLSSHPALVEQWTLPRAAQRDGADLLFYPDNSGALFPGLPMVLVQHDTMWRRPLSQAIARPTLKQRLQDRYRKIVCPRAAAAAKAVITISAHSAQCLDQALGLRPPKLTVIAEAADDGLRRPMAPGVAARVRKALGLKAPYVLASGAADKRKNVDRLIQAFAEARRLEPRFAGAELVITSLRPGEEATTDYGRIARESGVEAAIRFVGYVGDDQMKALYQGALCLAFPSLWEGFGLPVLEAFALACPVLLSREGSLPEVGGDAAVYADPYSVADLARGLGEAAFGRQRAVRVKRGLLREKRYTWKACAQAHLRVFEKAGASGTGRS
jgi:glycosyltransferase involved in cell wall biosynthesis